MIVSSSQCPLHGCSQAKIVEVSNIQWDDKRHDITLGGMTIALTPTEYRLLFPLRHGTPITYADLALVAYNYIADEKMRTMMDKHIDRIRGKLRGTGIYIYCVLNYGYLLLPEILPCELCSKTDRM